MTQDNPMPMEQVIRRMRSLPMLKDLAVHYLRRTQQAEQLLNELGHQTHTPKAGPPSNQRSETAQ